MRQSSVDATLEPPGLFRAAAAQANARGFRIDTAYDYAVEWLSWL